MAPEAPAAEAQWELALGNCVSSERVESSELLVSTPGSGVDLRGGRAGGGRWSAAKQVRHVAATTYAHEFCLKLDSGEVR